ncbi:MAG: hypothetical protein DMF77_04880 [Acidobacteria bacterium]|nr:MAG: hypothetical protein DMF77_04880 [Acidobacteriota bacterium]
MPSTKLRPAPAAWPGGGAAGTAGPGAVTGGLAARRAARGAAGAGSGAAGTASASTAGAAALGCASGAAARVVGVRGPKFGGGDAAAVPPVVTAPRVRYHHAVRAPAPNMTTASRRIRIGRAEPACDRREDGGVMLMVLIPSGPRAPGRKWLILAYDEQRRPVVAAGRRGQAGRDHPRDHRPGSLHDAATLR